MQTIFKNALEKVIVHPGNSVMESSERLATKDGDRQKSQPEVFSHPTALEACTNPHMSHSALKGARWTKSLYITQSRSVTPKSAA